MNTMTTVPAYTLQAISKMLLSNKGVDVTNIVKALAPGRDENVVAVQTALLMNGHKQEATQHVRYKVEETKRSWEPRVAVWRLDYVATAVYDQQVYYKRVLVYADTSNMSESESYKPGKVVEDNVSYETWENNYLDSKQFAEKYPDLAAAVEMGITGPVVDGPTA